MSKNKQSMKLYTEEQMRKALRAYFDLGKFLTENEIINALTPIELPSDEEIDEYVKSTGYYGYCAPEYHEGIEEGAKYVINKIQENNK